MYQQYLQARDSAARSSDAGMRESAEADSAAREPDSRLEQIIREGESYIPVSYTHLDVYKRQDTVKTRYRRGIQLLRERCCKKAERGGEDGEQKHT